MLRLLGRRLRHLRRRCVAHLRGGRNVSEPLDLPRSGLPNRVSAAPPAPRSGRYLENEKATRAERSRHRMAAALLWLSSLPGCVQAGDRKVTAAEASEGAGCAEYCDAAREAGCDV